MLHPLRTGLAATLLLAACSEAPAPDNEAAEADNAPVATPMPAATPAASEPSGAPRITAAGYDTIRIGQSPDAATGYALKDAGDMPGECRTFTSPKLPEAYVMVQDGLVRRITFFAPDSGTSPYRTERGIAPGASEAAIRKAYAPLAEEGHKYVAAPAKYLNYGGEGAPYGMRFEIDGEGRANFIHVGESPWLNYVEGCA